MGQTSNREQHRRTGGGGEGDCAEFQSSKKNTK